jgi:hypothetical protein
VRSLDCAGNPCGLALVGAWRLEYRVEDVFSIPVANRNVTQASDLRTERRKETLVIVEQVSGALLWGWDLPAAAATASQDDGPGGAGDGAGAMGSTSRSVEGAAGEVTGVIPQWAARLFASGYFSPPSHTLLAAAANRVPGAAYALFDGAEESLLLEVDPAAGEENLYRLARASKPGWTFRSGIWAVLLTSQPLGREWRQPVQKPAVATHTELAVYNPSGRDVTIRSKSRLTVRRDGLALWQASLLDHLWEDDGDERSLTATAVRVDGEPASFLHRNDQLLVDLGAARRAGDVVEVEVESAGDIAFRPVGDSYWLLGTMPWYPRQELDGEHSTMEIRVDVPEPWQPFASGTEVSRETVDGRARLHTRLDEPMQFATVLAGRYSVVSEVGPEGRAQAATYALPNEAAARKLIEKLYSGRRFFEELFGQPYPFRDQTIVEIRDWGWGQAPPGILLFSSEFYTAPTIRSTRTYFQDLDARYLHELAHGWWGHVAKMASPEDTWVSEAFADYTAALALWRLRGDEHGEYAFDELVVKWRRAASEISPGASLYLVNRLTLDSDRNFSDVWRLRYAKGPLVVHAIRLELQRQYGSVAEGDRYFIAFLRTFLARERPSWGTTQALVATLNELTGRDWQPWFDRYVYGTEMPSLG